MTSLEIIVTLAACCCIIILGQWWHARRVVIRAYNRAEHYRRLYLECPRSFSKAAESGLINGRYEGYQKCLADIERDQSALTATITSVTPRSETGGPEWKDPANVPALVMAELEPPTLLARPKGPGELTLWQEAMTGDVLAKMDAIRASRDEALR